MQQHQLKIMSLRRINRKQHLLRSLCTLSSKEINLKETVFLPKTDFPTRIKSTERSQLDAELAHVSKFSSLYEWQRNSSDRKSLPEFVLLDGPPYANGLLHVGHAVNKIMKDFVVKSQIASGHRVHFQPGWDCHGLPIELAVRRTHEEQDPVIIRQRCAEHAQKFIDQQANSFKRWGITADWQKPYITMNLEYVQRQLELFSKLFSSGVVYREFRPVYWSPSSRTALAESELEYNNAHKSLSAFFRFRLINADVSTFGVQLDAAASKKRSHLYALIWTTTPWNLPMNNAIVYNEKLPYCMIRLASDKGKPYNNLYIVCLDTVEELQKILNQHIEIVCKFDASKFNELFYRCAHHNEIALPFLKSNDVTNKAGTTGLVHASFSHGFNDYKVALENNIKLECFVDEDGRYERNLGLQLYGKSVLDEGNKAVLEMYKKHVVHSSDYTHSYPYDWRTKKPVIVRSSKQWFVNLSKVAHACIDELNAKNIKVQSGSHDQLIALVNQIKNRPDWCISRQRVWGVPIPAILNKETNELSTSTEFIKNTAALFGKNGCNSWWQNDINYFLNDQMRKDLGLTGCNELEKTTDIMDVWMDSGFAWSTLGGEQVADLIIEGHDQFRGWFQSLMLTSMLSRNVAPFRKALVHGFVVDEDNRKMSKSLGNVMDPQTVVEGSLSQNALGVDGLRLWVAMNGCEHSGDIRIGKTTLKELEQRINKMRSLLRFILGALKDYQGTKPESLSVLDQFIISSFGKLNERVKNYYADFRYRIAINELIQFTNNPLSSIYVNLVRDRLYCDHFDSESHVQVQFTLNVVGIGLVKLLAPILPHLCTEFVKYHPLLNKQLENSMQYLLDYPEIPHNLLVSSKDAEHAIEFTQKLRSMLAESSSKQLDFPKEAIQIKCDEQHETILRKLQSEDESVSSQLVELLGVSSVKIESGSQLAIQTIKPAFKFCARCRKHSCPHDHRFCRRCTDVLQNL